MVIVLKHDIKKEEKEQLRQFLEAKGCRVREIEGEQETIIGAVGSISFDIREVELLPGVATAIPISKPYKLASREFKNEDTVVTAGAVRIGGARIVVMAGPCAIESRDHIIETARMVRDSGATILRGGAYKPRSSPYSFQGLGEKALEFLKEAGEMTGMPVVTEIVSPTMADLVKEYADVLQIGARNMQNFELLKTVGSLQKPVLLKRGMSATIEELLMSAEYLLAHGAENVILCERGIRTFETYTRNTLDLSAIPVVKKLSHLPIVVDPSHGTGIRQKVLPMALAAIAAGAHGLMVEVHPDPDHALSDGPQSLYPDQFEKLMRDIEALAPVIEKEIARLPKKRQITAGTTEIVQAAKENLTVAFQGERGAFSEKAINRYFDEKATPLPCPVFRAVFDAVLEQRANYGIVPLENSLSGSIHENYDLLLQYPDIKIIGEKKIRIVHNLIAMPDARIDNIKRVYSHPQGLLQCAGFLDKYSAWERVAYYDTAGAVAFIAESENAENAAIASVEAAAVYKMEILKESVESNAHNYTRFVIIEKKGDNELEAPPEGFNIVSLVFSAQDKPGALYLALKVLSDRGLNMKKLESRPIHGKPWEYMFYVDVEVPNDMFLFRESVKMLKKVTDNLRILGIYRV